jgi:hypothetical protein
MGMAEIIDYDYPNECSSHNDCGWFLDETNQAVIKVTTPKLRKK